MSLQLSQLQYLIAETIMERIAQEISSLRKGKKALSKLLNDKIWELLVGSQADDVVRTYSIEFFFETLKKLLIDIIEMEDAMIAMGHRINGVGSNKGVFPRRVLSLLFWNNPANFVRIFENRMKMSIALWNTNKLREFKNSFKLPEYDRNDPRWKPVQSIFKNFVALMGHLFEIDDISEGKKRYDPRLPMRWSSELPEDFRPDEKVFFTFPPLAKKEHESDIEDSEEPVLKNTVSMLSKSVLTRSDAYKTDHFTGTMDELAEHLKKRPKKRIVLDDDSDES